MISMGAAGSGASGLPFCVIGEVAQDENMHRFFRQWSMTLLLDQELRMERTGRLETRRSG